MGLITVEEALRGGKRKAVNRSRWYEAAYERLRLSFWTTDRGPEARAEYESRLAELQSKKKVRGHQRKLTVEEIANRVGVLSYSGTWKSWICRVSGRNVWFGKDEKAARARWEALMIERGHGLCPGRGFFWNGLEQKWERGDELNERGRKRGRTERRVAGYKALLADTKRLRRERAELHTQMDEECRSRRRNQTLEMRVRWQSFMEKVGGWRRKYRASLLKDEQAEWDADRKRIRRRVNHRRKVKVEMFQRISRAWKDEKTGIWFSWIGGEHRKLVRLGDDEQKARVVWWVLRNALNAGSKMLRKPEGVQRTLDELLDIGEDRVVSRLRELGWTVERPASVPNSPERGRGARSGDVDRPQIS